MNRAPFQTQKPKEQRCSFSEKGQSAVEFAFIVPVLVLMLVIISDLGRIFFISIAVNDAARAGAQYGSQTNTTAADSAGMVSEASADSANIPNLNTPTASQCTCGTPNPPTAPACSTLSQTYCADASSNAVFVIVNTSATFNTILNYPGVPSPITLQAQAIMQVQETYQKSE
jgi:Flp pilus assembly protein TadG